VVINLLNLFFPKVCLSCTGHLSDNELHVCTDCRHQLPVTNFHFKEDDRVKKVFFGRVKVENATALLHFSKKGMVQQLMHNLKYRGHEDVGLFLGEWLGAELAQIEAYKTVDMVIPVPLHKAKQRKRGYNQVSKFGKAIATALATAYREDLLLKVSNTQTQVFKNRLTRWSDANAVFDIINPEELNNKHILLVDDIITTGATIEKCAEVLNKAKNIKLSVGTMAITD
jgi:ComF family protein